MWNLTKISATNVCAFRNLEYSPAQNVATLVFGVNLDDGSQDSNGSGKSALIESVALAILGSPLRKAKADEIINDFENIATVTIELFNPVLNQTLMVKRTFDRKADQKVEISLNNEPVVMPNVAEYNRYILESIGLTREQILSTYILCAYHFHSFLDASDKEKKEIINHFSNGKLVDQSIVVLKDDISKIKLERIEAEKDVAVKNDRVDLLVKEMEAFNSEAGLRQNRRDELIEAHKEAIAELHKKIRVCKETIDANYVAMDKLMDLDDEMRAVEDSDKDIIAAYKKVRELLDKYNVNTIHVKYADDYIDAQNQLQENEQSLEQLQRVMLTMSDNLTQLEGQYNSLNLQLTSSREESIVRKAACETKHKELKDSLDEAAVKLNDVNAKIESTQNTIAQIKNKLAGTIKCPKCSHKFILDSKASVEDLEKEKTNAEVFCKNLVTRSQNLNAKMNDIRGQISEVVNQMTDIDTAVMKLQAEVSSAFQKFKQVEGKFGEHCRAEARRKQAIESARVSIKSLRSRMFDEAFQKIDDKEAELNNLNESENAKIAHHNNSIKAYEEAIEELKNADDTVDYAAKKELLVRYNKELTQAQEVLREINERIERLTAQELRFNSFKTHLANTKIEALSGVTNHFLEHIGSSLRIAFSGYTMLKSGKLRDKISISMERDGVDCGSFGKLSVGEKSRGILANVLAMHKLCNANCPNGRGLNFLVMDEILDSTDETGIAKTADALSDIGLTSIIITHIPVADSYPHRLVITKENGISRI